MKSLIKSVLKTFRVTVIVGMLAGCSNEEAATPVKELFLGMTSKGGTSDSGVLFSVNDDGSCLKVEHNFTAEGGTSPVGTLTKSSNGKFYGMTVDGGENGAGVIFEYDPETHTYTKMIDFTWVEGAVPGSEFKSKLTLANKKFYGLTSHGGANNQGVLFEYDPTTNVYSVKHDFNSESGINPYGSLTLANDKLYGTAAYAGLNGNGTLFEFDPATSTFMNILDFDGNNGSQPLGSLTAVDDKLYGMTKLGGANDLGVLFEYDLVSTTYTKKLDFTGTSGAVIGSYPAYGSLTLVNGKLFGLTFTGGANNLGVLFEYNPSSNSYSKKLDFTGTAGEVKGRAPHGSLTLSSNGKLYGMAVEGGVLNMGILFEYDPATSAYTLKHEFMGTAEQGSLPFGDLLPFTDK